MENKNIKNLTKIAAVISLVFFATYIIKIPIPNGYVHIGDCMILIGVLILGGKKGAIAGGMGAALADFMGGYLQWVYPTLVIKFLMALVMGYFIEKVLPTKKYNWIVGSIIGGLIQIIGYATVESVYYGFAPAVLNIPVNVIQTGVGIVITGVFVGALQTRGLINKLKLM